MSNLYVNQFERGVNLPIPLGPISRVLINYHRNWGLNPQSSLHIAQLREAEASYIYEYNSSTGSRSRTVGAVTGRNYNQELNRKNGELVARLAFDIEGPIRIADIGCGDGATTKHAYDAMKKLWIERGKLLDDLKERLYITLIDPSVGMMNDAIERIRPLGIEYRVVQVAAHKVDEVIKGGSQDICMETGSLHHYPNPQEPYTAAHKVLKSGGIFILNEWSHSLFEHPVRFRSVLDRLQWPTKEEDLRRYDEFFRLDNYPEPEDPMEIAANKQMLDWYVDRFGRTVDYIFYLLEAHCPTRLTVEHLERSGFRIKDPIIDRLIEDGHISSNPDYLSSESSLHSTVVAVN